MQDPEEEDLDPFLEVEWGISVQTDSKCIE